MIKHRVGLDETSARYMLGAKLFVGFEHRYFIGVSVDHQNMNGENYNVNTNAYVDQHLGSDNFSLGFRF